jgi:MFS family permease
VILGIYHFLALLPPVLFGPFGGAIVDALPRRRVLILSDLLRGLIMLGLSALLWLRPESLWPLLALTFLGGFAHALFVPGARAILAELVAPPRLRRANALRTGITQVANLSGNAVGGIAYVVLGLPLLLLVNGVSFVASAIQETRIRPQREHPPRRIALRALMQDAAEGLRYVSHHRGLRTLTITGSAVQFITPPLVLSLPFVVADVLGLPQRFLGYYFALMLAGGILGFVLLSLLELGHRGEYRGFLGALVLFALAAATGGLFLSPVILAGVLFVAGLSIGVATVLVHTVIQRSVGTGHQGRVFAIVEMLAGSSAPLAYLLSGIVIDVVLTDLRLIYLMVAGLVALVALLAASSRRLRQFFAEPRGGPARRQSPPA